MSPFTLPRRSDLALRTRAGALRSDLRQVLAHGGRAPRRYQLLQVDTVACRTALVAGLPTAVSGQVRAGDWDLATRPLEEVDHIAFALAHWRDGVPWEETGAYADMLRLIDSRGGSHQGAATVEDVARRYARLDETFERVRMENRLRTRRELGAPGVREQGGVLIHVGRDGQPVYNGWSGCHRLAMAIALDLPSVPAVIGVVHPDALDSWQATYLPTARRRRAATEIG